MGNDCVGTFTGKERLESNRTGTYFSFQQNKSWKTERICFFLAWFKTQWLSFKRNSDLCRNFLSAQNSMFEYQLQATSCCSSSFWKCIVSREDVICQHAAANCSWAPGLLQEQAPLLSVGTAVPASWALARVEANPRAGYLFLLLVSGWGCIGPMQLHSPGPGHLQEHHQTHLQATTFCSSGACSVFSSSISNSAGNAPGAPTAIAAQSASRLQLEYLIGNCVFSVTGPDWRWHCGDSQRNGVADVRPTYCGRNRGFHGRRPRQRQVIWLLVQPKEVMVLNVPHWSVIVLI